MIVVEQQVWRSHRSGGQPDYRFVALLAGFARDGGRVVSLLRSNTTVTTVMGWSIRVVSVDSDPLGIWWRQPSGEPREYYNKPDLVSAVDRDRALERRQNSQCSGTVR